MKTTQSQQNQTRRAIVASAVELMSRQGFERTTMRDIARGAQIGDATIYRYFATKEKLALGYFDQVVGDALAATQRTPGLAQYSLQEKLQRLTDAVLEQMLPNREFVALLQALAARSPLLLLGDGLAGKQALSVAVQQFLETAQGSGEMEPCSYQAALGSLYADYLLAVVAYWLADSSDEFADTTQLVDLSLGVLVLVLQVGLINRVLQLGGFVLRSQLARLLTHGSGVLDLLRLAQGALASRARGANPGFAKAATPGKAPPSPPENVPAKPARKARKTPAKREAR